MNNETIEVFKLFGCALSGALVVMGIALIIMPVFNLFKFLKLVPWWVGIPLLILSGLLFQHCVEERGGDTK